MAPRGIKIKKDEQNELSEMFNEMMGEGKGESSIVVPKYKKLVQRMNYIQRFILTFCNKMNDIFDIFEIELNEMVEFANTLDFPLEGISDEEICKIYKESKMNDTRIAIIMKTCSNLLVHKKYLSDKNNLRSTFITNSPGTQMDLLPFTSLNFKMLFSTDEIDEMIELKKYILFFLHTMYIESIEIYKIITSPDIDIDKFSEVLIGHIDSLRSRIPRCNSAFNKLKESVGLLKSNFGTYYKDFIQTSNSTVMMENFIIDVSRSTNADAKTLFQFKKIIKFLRDNSQKVRQHNPQSKKLFSMMDNKFSEIENLL